jgi:hypothetical protein
VSKINDKIKEISGMIDEHIVAVKGTLELADASLSEDDLHTFLLKAIERMDDVQKLSNEMVAIVNLVFEKMAETKNTQKINEFKE